MSYLLLRLRAALAAWDVILLAVALTAGAYHIWPGWMGQAREAAALGERIVWQEKQRRADIRAEDDRRAAQAKINAAETQLINTMAASAIRQSELQAAIAEMEKTDAEKPKPDAGSAAACPAVPFMPERVRNALNSIGR